MPIRPSRHSPDPSLSLGFSLAVPVGTDAIQRSVSQSRVGLSGTTGASGSGDASKERDASASECGARGRCVSPPAGRPWAMVGSAARAPGRQLFQTRLPRGGANLDPDPRLALPPPAAERSAEGAAVMTDDYGDKVVGGGSFPTRGGRYFIYRPPLGSVG